MPKDVGNTLAESSAQQQRRQLDAARSPGWREALYAEVHAQDRLRDAERRRDQEKR